MARRTLFEVAAQAALAHLRAGEVTLVCRDGAEKTFAGSAPGPSARVELRRPRASRRAVCAGSIGLAEGYMDGDWDTPDLDAVLDAGIAHYVEAPRPAPAMRAPASRAFHAVRDNSLSGSRRNVAAHYDLGNDFYALWLDETMTYSSALYSSEIDSLAVAQRRKWDRLLDLIQPSSRDHLLEIGCGWGGFALHAAKRAGCRVTGLTLSAEQRSWARSAVEREGLEGRVDIRLQDYRQVPERFSGIVSIEMFEAVGERWWPVFFRQLVSLLPRGGAAALQTITIDDARFEDYRSSPDFIQRYIFPGGMLPSPERFAQAARTEGVRVSEPLFFGESYARTLCEWATRFEAALPLVRGLGFDERFIRMWRFYLSYCRAGFSAGTVDVMQVRLET
jgi:cyclopropane-fatty-acyl-phospholipid synthase